MDNLRYEEILSFHIDKLDRYIEQNYPHYSIRSSVEVACKFTKKKSTISQVNNSDNFSTHLMIIKHLSYINDINGTFFKNITT